MRGAMNLFQHRICMDYAGLADRMRKSAAEAEGSAARRTYLLLADHWHRPRIVSNRSHAEHNAMNSDTHSCAKQRQG